MKSSAARAIEELRPMDSEAHRRLYLPVVRALPQAARVREPVPVFDVPLYAPAKSSAKEGGDARAVTVSMKRLSKRVLAVGAVAYPESITRGHEASRPTLRADCLPGGKNEQRPCPWIRCKHHLAVDVDEDTGSIKVNRPDRETWGAPRTCELDVADEGPHTLEEVGEIMNLTRERTRQIEMKALKKIRAAFQRAGRSVEQLDLLIAGMEKW